jgi:predicted nucleic acid-binding Zn ribbon protein
MSRHDGMKAFGASLERVVGGLGARSAMLDLHGRWPEVVGEAIAEHCRPRRLEGTHLSVEVDHPGWASEIRYLEVQILARLAEVLPDTTVDSLSIVVARPRT